MRFRIPYQMVMAALGRADVNVSAVKLKNCLRDPISEIFKAAEHLDAAISAHFAGNRRDADSLIRLADNPLIAEWTESLWGVGGPWSRPLRVERPAPFVEKDNRIKMRMPSSSQKRALLQRDGFHCKFCGIPVVRAEMRLVLRTFYPDALRWGGRNTDQHAGFQAMWLQYDHVLPHARGGTNEIDNVIVTCAPCNNGRSNLTLEEVGLADPRERPPIRSSWDGLERVSSSK